MPAEIIGRRLPVVDGKPALLEKAGDYTGPVTGFSGEGKVAVFYLLPIARDDDSPKAARSVFHVCIPPHRAIENDDGSLTLRESIGNPHWHGFLNRGHRWCLNRDQDNP